MYLKLRSLSRFCPRFLTLVVVSAAMAMISIANVSFDEASAGDGGVHYRSYGWPMIWHRLVLTGFKLFGSERAIGWYWSVPRLFANLVMWLALLAALAGACEWLLRRYRPRPRWRLRTMFVLVALAAALCGWYAKANNRAAIQDPLIPLTGGYGAPLVFVERSGPRWLDLLGLDRLRRRIVLASNWTLDAHEPNYEQRFLQLARLRDVRHLTQFQVDELTPTTGKALSDMRQLQTLGINLDRLTPEAPAALSELRQVRSLSIAQRQATADEGYTRLADECLAAIGNMTNLEALSLSDLPLHGNSLACLSGLKNLKSLQVNFWNGEWNDSKVSRPHPEDCLRAITTLTQLEWLTLAGMRVRSGSLAYLAELTDLKTLRLSGFATDGRHLLSRLPPLWRVEALDLYRANIDDDDLRRLAVLPRLKLLHLGQTLNYEKPLFTPAGLATLASVESLEELGLAYDIETSDEVEPLRALTHLKRLHLFDNSFGPAWADLTLDDGEELHVDLGELEGFQRALKAIRQSNPGIIIDNDISPVFWGNQGGRAPELDAEAIPERPSAWLPGSDTVWMTPQELTDFEKTGGCCNFYGATFPAREDKGLITVHF